MEIRADGRPPLVLDAGTGARKLGYKLVSEPSREMDLLFTHLHMDHVFGFPFFLPIYTPGYSVRVGVPAFSEDDAREKLGRYLNGIYHPTRLRELPAAVTYAPVRPGRAFTAGAYRVLPFALNHPGGSVGYRVEVDGRSIAYVTDTSPFARPGEGVAAGKEPVKAEARAIEWLTGCDLVVYDTMYDYEEYLEKMTWGHSYPEYAAAICQAAGVRHLVLFHHLPDASDEYLDQLGEKWAAYEGMKVTLAVEGESVEVTGSGGTSTSRTS
ncbi:MAG: MBL fold metallo-hydrolase [Myxococcales bacterium]|nr:MBL fold metallo-hydrolase [Myxococcales bacterium]